MSAWEAITDQDVCNKLSRKVGSKWDFSPSTKVFPGIREPQGSLTYQISAVYATTDDEYHALLGDLGRKTIKAFKQALRDEDWVYATDIHHYDFYLRPAEAFDAGDPYAWEVPLFPNGDYSIFYFNGGQMGFFGHPWEQTICIFGQPLVQAFAKSKPKIFDQQHLVRADGKPVAPMGPRARIKGVY